MDEYGVVNQARALRHRNAFALWYAELLRAKDSERDSLIAESIRRHSDRLMETIIPHVTCFAKGLAGIDIVGNPVEAVRSRFGINLSNERERERAALSHNAFICSISPEGWHLSTGHIFVMNESTWICLSPSCDMVPSQISKIRIKELGGRLPFMAVKLRCISSNSLPRDLNSGRYIFYEVDGKVKSFSFNPQDANSEPDWEILYAENRGIISARDFQFTVNQIIDDQGNITCIPHSAQVVAQLRYEYALNLVHKLGGFLTRIGLDFTDGRRISN